MFTQFILRKDGSTETRTSIEELEAPVDGVTWIDLDGPTDEALRVVGERFALDPEALEDCLYGDQRPRIDEFEEYFFLVLYGATKDNGEEEIEFDPSKLAVFFHSNFLITVHRDQLKTIRQTRERCSRNPSQLLGHGSERLLHAVIDRMADRYIEVAESFEERLEALEDASLLSEVDEAILTDLSELRTPVLELRRIATSQRELLAPLARGEYDFFSDALEQRFRHVVDHLVKVVELTDALRERLTGVRDNYHAALTARTNEIMKTLTVFAAMMLPMSVLTGIYGMNLPGWPPSDHPLGFWGVLATMAVIAGALLVYFKRKRWL